MRSVVICFIALLGSSLAQEMIASPAEVPPINNEATDNAATDAPVGIIDTVASTNPICQVCECYNRTVNCRNRNLKSQFERADWDGLQDFRPVSVDLSQNPLGTLTKFSNITTLKYLNVSNCGIESIEAATFSYLSNLVSIDLSWNKLDTSSLHRKVFVGLLDSQLGVLPYQNMKYLNLAHNDIHSLAQDTFAFMTTLKTLDLSGNPLQYIDQVTMGAITGLEDLKELRLSGCMLETLPEGIFRRNRRLKRLDLSDNRFASVPATLIEAVNLEFLDFGKNPIDILNATNPILKLKELKELRLSRLPKLHTITDGGLSGLEDLEILDLSFNPKLINLEDDFLSWPDEHTDHETWPPLRELYLNNNNLSTVYSGYLERWDLLSRVDLSKNPFQCDCTNQWLIDVFVPLVGSTESNNTLADMICKKPKEMKGITIMQLHNASKVLACQEAENILESTFPDMAIILGIMIGIFATFPVVLVVILLWRRGTFARCRHRRTDSSDSDVEETDAF